MLSYKEYKVMENTFWRSVALVSLGVNTIVDIVLAYGV